MDTIVYLLSAFALGAGHALEPGHGKTVVGAYLVGTRGRAIDAVLLGVIVTLTHTAGVLALGALALLASAYVSQQAISRFLQLPAGLLVLIVGLFVLRDAARMFARSRHSTSHAHQRAPQHAQEDGAAREHNSEHSSEHNSEHDHEHGHVHPALPSDQAPGLGVLVTLGVSGGLIPCPTALAVLLAAIGNGQATLGLISVIVFSIGLTVVLVVIGLMMVGASTLARQRLPGPGLARWARLASGLLVTGLGVYMTIEAFIYQGWIRIA